MHYQNNNNQCFERSWRNWARGTFHGVLSAAMVLVISGSASNTLHTFESQQSMAMQGQILLLHDDCHRALDDPSSINRYSFKTFHQYVNYCVERRLRDANRPYKKPRLA